MNPRIRDWRGKRVWIIGASSGIGEALAKELALRGAHLALSARTASRLNAMGTDGLVLPCDATNSDSLKQTYQSIRVLWGGVDLVIYLAAD